MAPAAAPRADAAAIRAPARTATASLSEGRVAPRRGPSRSACYDLCFEWSLMRKLPGPPPADPASSRLTSGLRHSFFGIGAPPQADAGWPLPADADQLVLSSHTSQARASFSPARFRRSVALEVLDLALVLLGGGAAGKRAEIPALPVCALLLRVESVFARFQLPDHEGCNARGRSLLPSPAAIW